MSSRNSVKEADEPISDQDYDQADLQSNSKKRSPGCFKGGITILFLLACGFLIWTILDAPTYLINPKYIIIRVLNQVIYDDGSRANPVPYYAVVYAETGTGERVLLDVHRTSITWLVGPGIEQLQIGGLYQVWVSGVDIPFLYWHREIHEIQLLSQPTSPDEAASVTIPYTEYSPNGRFVRFLMYILSLTGSFMVYQYLTRRFPVVKTILVRER